MLHRIRLPRAAAVALVILLSSPGWAQAFNENLRPEDPLRVRVDLFDKFMRGNHWNEGTIMPHVIFPPAGKDTPIVGSQEDCALHTGGYLAALSFRYAVTKEPDVRTWADQTMEGILKLEQVTGQSGCVARSFNKTDAPGWHEQAFFFPMEWHESTSMPGYRWEGDLGSNQFTGLMYGVTIYWELCADDAHKKIAVDFVDRIMGRCLDNNLKIIDVDNKMTSWGNFCPDLPHESLNALLILAHLKTALHMTEKVAYQTAYQRVLIRYHFDDEAILAKVLWPVEWRNGSNDHPAAMAFYHLMRFENNPSLLQKYRMGLNRFWYLWKEESNPFYAMLYQTLTGEKAVTDNVIQNIKQLYSPKRAQGSWTVQLPEGPKTFESEYEEAATGQLRNYWFGRHLGIIDPEW